MNQVCRLEAQRICDYAVQLPCNQRGGREGGGSGEGLNLLTQY